MEKDLYHQHINKASSEFLLRFSLYCVCVWWSVCVFFLSFIPVHPLIRSCPCDDMSAFTTTVSNIFYLVHCCYFSYVSTQKLISPEIYSLSKIRLEVCFCQYNLMEKFHLYSHCLHHVVISLESE